MPSTINATPTSSGLIQTADNSGVLALQTGGTTAVTVNTAQDVLVGGTTAIDGGVGVQVGDTSAGNAKSTLQLLGNTNSWVQFGNGLSGASRYLGWVQYNYASNYMTFATNSTERMRITNAGLVGIGNTAPATNLSVTGNILAGNANAVANGGGFDSYMAVNRSGSSDSVSYNLKNGTYETNIGLNSSWAFGVYDATASTYRFSINHSGLVYAAGIYSNTSSNSANVLVYGANGDLYRSTSALKYKQDIRDLPSIDINKFRPVVYKSKCNIDDQTIDHFGIIADEVDEAGIKELVHYGDDGQVENFKYDRLTVVLLKALQELKAQVDAQALEIQALKGVA